MFLCVVPDNEANDIPNQVVQIVNQKYEMSHPQVAIVSPLVDTIATLLLSIRWSLFRLELAVVGGLNMLQSLVTSMILAYGGAQSCGILVRFPMVQVLCL